MTTQIKITEQQAQELYHNLDTITRYLKLVINSKAFENHAYNFDFKFAASEASMLIKQINRQNEEKVSTEHPAPWELK